jgi:hypothetical protein
MLREDIRSGRMKRMSLAGRCGALLLTLALGKLCAGRARGFDVERVG